MKKFLCLAALIGFSYAGLYAGQFTGTAGYAGSSEFSQVKASALWTFAINWTVGLEGKYAKEDIFKDPVYTVKLPMAFSSDALSFTLTPFYYFKNKSDVGREYNAFGINGKLILTLEDDGINELYSHAYLGAAFARQEGTRLYDTGRQTHNYFSQAAYTAGLHKNFFRAFSFEAIGTLFQYPDGITGINEVRGILDQQDLAFLQSYDIVHELPKYTVGARITRLWADTRATIYASYRFGEFYTSLPEHSIVVGNTFTLHPSVLCDLAYNHLQTVKNDNKRDIFYAQVKFIF